jgi:hypothetical protein
MLFVMIINNILTKKGPLMKLIFKKVKKAIRLSEKIYPQLFFLDIYKCPFCPT